MRIMFIYFLLASCHTVPFYKYVYQIHPEHNKICRYDKISQLENIDAVCYNITDELPDGSYRFHDTIAMKKQAFKEKLRDLLDAAFND